MPTDDERREVARRLRAAEGPSLMVLMGVLGVGGEGVFARLADLIEPSCDRDELLALAEEMHGYADGAASGDGFPYVNAGSLWSYADRIREALEVES